MKRRSAPMLASALVAAFVVLAQGGCTARRQNDERNLATPAVRQFLDFAASYRGRQVRLGPLRAERVEVGRPLVFASIERDAESVVVLDARLLAARKNIEPGQLVVVVIQCTEGQTDSGNMLLDLAPYTTAAEPAR